VWVRVPPSATHPQRPSSRVVRRGGASLERLLWYSSCVSVDIAPVPRPEWSPLGREGAVGVEGKVLVREAAFFVALLRFQPHATIDEHPGANDTLVVCLEGDGFTSVGDATAALRESERVFWPAKVPHRLWTERTPMKTLMIERAGVGFPERGLAEPSG